MLSRSIGPKLARFGFAVLGGAMVFATVTGAAASDTVRPAASLPPVVSPSTALPAASGERATLLITGSTLIKPFTDAIMQRLMQNAGLPPAVILPTGTGKGVKAFCAGVGIDTPDIVAVSRRMRHREYEECTANGVTDIVEIQIGYEALVVISRLDDSISLSLDDFYRGIAEELPDGDEFLENTYKTWRDIRPGLPDTPIGFILPSRDLGARGFFSDRFLQGACRNIFEIKSIFSAEERVRQCVNMRDDNRIVEVGVPFVENVRKALMAAKPGTLAVTSFRHAQELSDVAQIVAFDGSVPTYETIADREYDFTRPLYYYVKRAHVKDYMGRGPVLGLREFITEVTRETTFGRDGYLAAIGLVPMSASERERVRYNALHLYSASH